MLIQKKFKMRFRLRRIRLSRRRDVFRQKYQTIDDSDGGTTWIADYCYEYWKHILVQATDETRTKELLRALVSDEKLEDNGATKGKRYKKR